jgi:hypothetical protein
LQVLAMAMDGATPLVLYPYRTLTGLYDLRLARRGAGGGWTHETLFSGASGGIQSIDADVVGTTLHVVFAHGSGSADDFRPVYITKDLPSGVPVAERVLDVGLTEAAQVSMAAGPSTVHISYSHNRDQLMYARVFQLPAQAAILIIDANAGTNFRGALFSVNATTGQRTVVSDFGAIAQGSLGRDPVGVAVEANGSILVIDANAGTNFRGALFQVDAGGNRMLLSDFGALAHGPLGVDPAGVAPETNGSILVSDFSAGTSGRGALFRVDGLGNRSVLSNFGNGTQGPLGVDPAGVALKADGTILVGDAGAATDGRGALFSVDAGMGTRTLLSNFGNSTQGVRGMDPSDVAVRQADGSILVIDPSAGTGGRGALFRVEASGTRTVVSDFGAIAQGPLGVNPVGVTVQADGSILVIDLSAGTGNRGALFRVNAGGIRTPLSDFGNSTQGPLGVSPSGVAIQ